MHNIQANANLNDLIFLKSETRRDRKQWKSIFQGLRQKTSYPEFSIQRKIAFRNEENKDILR